MPWTNNAQIDALRRKYNAAFDAHRECHRSLAQAKMRGEEPSPRLIDDEKRTLRALTEIRAELLAAMTSVIMGDDSKPPT